MAINRAKRPRDENTTMQPFTSFVTIILTLLFISAFYLVISFTPPTKEEQMESFMKVNQEVDPFRKNISECARQVKASMADVETFLKGVPQTSLTGKCFVACILKRNGLITKNKINREMVLQANKEVYGDTHEVIPRLKAALSECSEAVKEIFEICEYASTFNDCMHIQMEHVLHKINMDRRMEAVGQQMSDPSGWSEEEDELLQLAKDEL